MIVFNNFCFSRQLLKWEIASIIVGKLVVKWTEKIKFLETNPTKLFKFYVTGPRKVIICLILNICNYFIIKFIAWFL